MELAFLFSFNIFQVYALDGHMETVMEIRNQPRTPLAHEEGVHSGRRMCLIRGYLGDKEFTMENRL